MKWNTRT
ncbi:hypothetical protein D043_4970A, partial [Vibrio parahaemolyticus EKP-021]